MSNQPEHDNQQPEILTPEEVRQFILAELEASKQEIAELSDEQLTEIAGAGGYQDPTRGLGTAVVGFCASCGAIAGTHIAQTVGAHPAGGFALGGLIGGAMGAAILPSKRNTTPRPEEDPQTRLNKMLKGMDKLPEQYGYGHPSTSHQPGPHNV